MANVKITEMTELAEQPATGDMLPIADVSANATKKINRANLLGSVLQIYAGISPSSNVQSVLGAADYSAIRTLLGLVIGTNVQAYDADLTTWAGLTPSANAQSLVTAADYSAMRTLLGLVIGTNVQAYDADLTTWAGITPGTGVGTALAVNVGSSGAFVVLGGALGTPSSGTLTSCTGLPVGTGISGFGTNVATALAVNVGSAGAFVTFNGALGTPSSGTLTNCTGLPVAGITGSTSTALGVGSVELGHASDTTLSRSSAGVLAVESVVVPTISSTNTLTNKRITPRRTTETSSATPTINTDNCDIHSITALATAITSFTSNLTGTPTHGQALRIEITDNGTARGITWGASFEASGTVALPTTTVISTMLTVGFFWNSATNKWRCAASA